MWFSTDSAPTSRLVQATALNQDGARTFSATVPAIAAGFELTFQSSAVHLGRRSQSDPVTVTVP